MHELAQPINIFICSAHEDEHHVIQIRLHLSTLQRQHKINFWHNGEVQPGTEWEKEIAEHLNIADIVLLLVSCDFMASPLYNIGLKALERYEKENIYVIRCIVRPVDVEGDPLSMLQMLPAEAKPVSSWQDRDEAYKDIALELRRIVRRISSQHLIKQDEQVSLITSPDLKKAVNTLAPERLVNSFSPIYNSEILIEGEIGGESPTPMQEEIGGESPRSASFLQRLLGQMQPAQSGGQMQPAQSGGQMQPAQSGGLPISRDPGMQPELLPHNPAEEEHQHFKKQIEKQIKDTTSGALIIYGKEKLLLHPIYLVSHFRWQFAPQKEKRDLETLGNEAFQYFLDTALYKGTSLEPVAGRPGRPAELQAAIEVFKRYKTPSGYICAAIFRHLPQDDYLVWMTPNNPISIGVFTDTITMIDLGQTNRRIS